MVDKLQAEATTVDDEQQADVRMVAPTATHNNQSTVGVCDKKGMQEETRV